MQIAVHPNYNQLLGNNAFDPDQTFNKNGSLDRWIHTRRKLQDLGIQMDTYDLLDNPRDADAWIVHEPTRSVMKFMALHRINPRRVVLVLIEPPLINTFAWRWLSLYGPFFGAIMTWHSGMARRGRNFVDYRFPLQASMDLYETRCRDSKYNQFVLVRSNKSSELPGEHYSVRRNIIRAFEDRGDRMLDLYGPGWNDDNHPAPLHTPLWQGLCGDKVSTYAKYEFVFCFDNSTEPGYVTEDVLTAMAAGAVPIYWPPPDIYTQLPKGTFIDVRDFPSVEEIIEYAVSIRATKDYDRLRENGERFLRSPSFRRFTNDGFCNSVRKALSITLPRRKRDQIIPEEVIV